MLSPLRAEGVFPAQERRRDAREDRVGGLAEHGEGDDRGDDLRRLAELLAVDQEIAEAFRGAHELGRHHEHPAEPEPGAQRDHVGRQHRGKQDAADHGGPDRRKTRPTSTILRSTDSTAPITPR